MALYVGEIRNNVFKKGCGRNENTEMVSRNKLRDRMKIEFIHKKLKVDPIEDELRNYLN